MPSALQIETSLRKAISSFLKAEKYEELTLKRVRQVAAGELGLPEDFFKTDSLWKDRSKTFVTAEVSRQENELEVAGAPSEVGHASPSATTKSSEVPAKSKASATTSKPVTSATPEGTVSSGKKKSVTPASPASLRKVKTSSSPKLSSPLQSNVKVPKSSSVTTSETAAKRKPAETKQTPAKKRRKTEDSDDDSDSSSADEPAETNKLKPTKNDTKPIAANVEDDDSDSSLSSIIDDGPAPKRKSSSKGTSSKSSKPKSAAQATSLTPDEEEIKRLQGWLIKCGIRKLWHRELAAYETPKAKVAHLRTMLKDAGMDGKYTVEKARQIKEDRELKADLEAVQEGNKMWGNANDINEDSATRPKRPMARGLQDLAFLDGDEESD